VSSTTRRPAEVLREGSGVRVEGAAAAGLTISAYIKDAGNPPFGRGLPGLIYNQQGQSNAFLLRAVTGTGFLAIRPLLEEGSERLSSASTRHRY